MKQPKFLIAILAACLLAAVVVGGAAASPASEVAKLTAGDAEIFDQFGSSVAVSGDTAVVGAFRHDDAASNTGSAYVFVLSSGSWTQQAKLTASDGAQGHQFGISVAVSGDTAVIGTSAERAYVFVRNSGSWSQQAKLTAGDAAANDFFGWNVAVSGDTAVVSAFRDDDAGGDSGSAYVFARSGGSWSEQAKLTASDAAPSDFFGISVAVSGDTAVVGAHLDDDAGEASGSAYLFVRDEGGADKWGEVTKLKAGDAAAGDFFGRSVAVSGDTTVVGAYKDDDAGTSSGSAYVFVRDEGGADKWGEVTKLTAGDAAAVDEFGISVAVSGDTIVVGAHKDDDGGSNSGSAYVFVRSGEGWSQQAKLTASDAVSGDQFGLSVAVSGDTAVVGAFKHDDDVAGTNAGSAYVFGQDTAPPDTNITSATNGNGDAVPKSGSSPSDSITFLFSGTDNVGVAEFECSLDGAGFTPCISPISYDSLALGSHTFQVRAIDLSGFVDPTPANFDWTILTIQLAIQKLTDDVNGLVPEELTSGQAKSLVRKLRSTRKHLDRGNTVAACHKLQDFIDQVDALIRGGVLGPAQGQPLIDLGTSTRNAIGC